MIKQTIIDELRNRMEITEVLNSFLTLKKNTACCPFHDEKTPSFHVWRNKQTFKCFGCGEGGDTITFVMKHEHKSFTEAVEWLCEFYKVPVEWDQATEEENQEKKELKEEMLQIVSWAQKKYEKLLTELPEEAPVLQYLKERGYSHERMRSWSLGYAPDDWKFLTTPCINMGKHTAATTAGLVYTNDGKNWDFYRNRLTIPIHDHNGVLIGLAGRQVPSGKEAEDKQIPKYVNPCESLIYSKSKVWYGLHQAQRAIKEAGFAYAVEGYLDVQAMHDADVCNTIAACGTEIDDLQIKFLKRYTEHVVIGFDGDKTGVKKAMKQVDAFLKHDFKVGVIEFPDKMDPDEYIKHIYATHAGNQLPLPEGHYI